MKVLPKRLLPPAEVFPGADLDDADHPGNHVCWDWLVAPDIARVRPGGLMSVVKYRPSDLDAESDGRIEGLHDGLSNVFSLFRTGWCLHFDEHKRHARTVAQKAVSPETPGPLLAAAAQHDQETAPGSAFERRQYAAVTQVLPRRRLLDFDRLLLSRGATAPELLTTWDETLDQHRRIVSPLAAIFAANMASARVLFGDDLISYLANCVSPNDQVTRAGPHVVGVPLEQVVFDSHLVPGSFPEWLDGDAEIHIRCLSVQKLPRDTDPTCGDVLSLLPFEYRWCQRFLALSPLDAAAVLWWAWRLRQDNAQNLWDVIRGMVDKERPEDDPVLMEEALEAAAARIENARPGSSTGYYSAALVVWDANVGAVEDKVDDAASGLRSAGFRVLNDRIATTRTWLSTLPGDVQNNMRRKPLPAVHVSHCARLSAPSLGVAENQLFGGPPLLWCRTRDGERFGLDFHVQDRGNALLVAETGLGKSTLIGAFGYGALQAHSAARFFYVDVHSRLSTGRVAALAAGGEFFDFAEGDVALQPFAHVDEGKSERSWCFRFAMELLGHNAERAPADVEAEVNRALDRLAGETNRRDRTLSNFAALLQDPEARKKLRFYLGGPLDAGEDRFSQARFVTVDATVLLEENAGPERAPELTALLHRIEREADGERPLYVAMDESRLALRRIPRQIDEMLLASRKRRMSLILAIHTLGHLDDTGIAEAVIANTSTKIFLANADADKEGIRERHIKAGLPALAPEIIAKAVPYRDLYVHRKDGISRLVSWHPDPVTLALCGAGGGQDALLCDRLLAVGDERDFALRWLAAKRLIDPLETPTAEAAE